MIAHRKMLVLAATVAAGAAAVLTPSSAEASTLIGTQYQHANYAGSYWNSTVASNGFTCTGTVGDVDAQVASTPAGWNDIVSSFRNYSYCYTRVFEHNSYGGASLGYIPSTGYVGDSMNDRTSSVRWS
jgi:hypothetical protein